MTDRKTPKSNPIRDSKIESSWAYSASTETVPPSRSIRIASSVHGTPTFGSREKPRDLGFEAFVSAAHWKSFGGDDHYSGDLMETFSWAGAVAAITQRIGIISTIHVRSFIQYLQRRQKRPWI